MDAPLPSDHPAARRPPGRVGSAVAGLAAGLLATILLWFYWEQILSLLFVGAVVAGGVGLFVRHRRQIAREHEAELRAREAELRERAHLDRVDVMSGVEFEELTARLLERDGFLDVEVVGRSRDRGIDVLATAPDGRELAVQCKRQAKPVGADRVRNLIGAVHSSYAGRVGVLVTNNTFTAQAREEAGRVEPGRLFLVGRDDLARWMDGGPFPP
ncbi:restriction endonuclease [Actinomadura oligospora]|uniref:restriction endonuclease n=1 Tax=Actinomadura oligospora TaxID=111804 RepID=UPI0004B4A518|nr:restriction endonuclease [Actinomadura oligospora]